MTAPRESDDDEHFLHLLRQAREGDPVALDRVLPMVYDELHRIAQQHMARERGDHTLQPTALVHEAYVRLARGAAVDASGRAHFLRVASQIMRRVLVDHARARQALKRSATLMVTIDRDSEGGGPAILNLLVLDDALEQLAAAEPRWARVVELRFFAGLEVEEVAEALSISTATVKRDWRFARAWLAQLLDVANPMESPPHA